MLNIEIIKKGNISVIDSKLLHKELEVKSYHADWIRRRIDGYGFIKNKDYYIDHISTVRGGTKRKSYLMTVDMCKHLAMIENNHTGQRVREYFIEIEKQYIKHKAIRLSTLETRKTLTDKIQESGENERMHGHGYSTYTKLIYSLTGLTEMYKEWKTFHKNDGSNFRDILNDEYLKRVELAESIIKPLIEMNKQYAEIKDIMKPLFEKKELLDKKESE